MPTYSYECRKCGRVTEVFHAMSANPRVKCPKCGGSCKRLLGTGVGLVFKGSGFYETDYKRSAKAEPAPKGDTPSKAEPKKAAASGGESDPKSSSSAEDCRAPLAGTLEKPGE